MTIQEQQSGDGTQRAPQDIGAPEKSSDKSRRSFAKSGLVASGVLLTLSSRPVLGELVCKTPSGFQSGNLSFHGTPITCAGLIPKKWIDPTKNWPSSYAADKTTTTTKVVSSGRKKIGQQTSFSSITSAPLTTTTTIPGTKFSSVFNCSNEGMYLAELTMTQVLTQGDPLGAHCVAALLNAASMFTPVLTEAQVKNIFNEFDSKGYFEPTVGQKWYPGDIVAYLKTTMS
ncbi:MAG: hypothetical protein ABL869_08545 [Candidatus Nitrotoga sp.]